MDIDQARKLLGVPVKSTVECHVTARLTRDSKSLLLILDPFRQEVAAGGSPCTHPPAYEAWVRTDSGEHHLLVCEEHAVAVRWPEGKIVRGYSNATCVRIRTYVYTDVADMTAATLRDLLNAS